MNYSQRIRGLRLRLKLNQQQFAEKMGVSQGTISRWESGSQIPSVEFLNSMQQFGHFESSDIDEDIRYTFQSKDSREVTIVGAIESNKLVDTVEWEYIAQKHISIPNYLAWKDIEIKSYEVLDNGLSTYTKGSLVLITPFVKDWVEPEIGDQIVFAEKHQRTGRYEILLGLIQKTFSGNLNLQLSGLDISLSYSLENFIISHGGFLEAGFVGLVIGGFITEDQSRFQRKSKKTSIGE